MDDLWFLWYGTDRQFSLFLTALNDLGAKDNFTLKGSVGDSIEFLDVKLTVKDGNVDTTIYIKPTDSTRYLNRRSDHSSHMFKAIPFSQFRRAIVICSSADESRRCIEHMEKKFIDSGYSREELLPCKEKALALDRDTILREHRSTERTAGEEDILTFVINHDPDMVKMLRDFLLSKQDLLLQLIGSRKIVISERRSPNTASLLFAKSAFSATLPNLNTTQKCGGRNCKLCDIMEIPRNFSINNFRIKLDFSLNCKSDCCIYLAVCSICNLTIEFYFGQTVTPANIRFNGHRSSFKLDDFKYKVSALSEHVFDKHPEVFDSKLNNYKVGIIKSCKPKDLNRYEDYYIYSTKADSISLNRYKVLN